MTTLTPTQWNVLTFIQWYERTYHRTPRNSEIQAGCGLASKGATIDVLLSLQAKGLIDCNYFMSGGVKIRCARSNCKASGMVGLEVPTLEKHHAESRVVTAGA